MIYFLNSQSYVFCFSPPQDRKQPDVCDNYFHDVPFEAHFASDIPELQAMTAMPGVDGFTMKVDALYKVCEKSPAGL